MMSRSMTDILGEDGHQVNLTMKEVIPLENGLLNREVLIDRKRKIMNFGIDYLREEFIEVTKIPHTGSKMEVDLSIDMVVLPGESFRRLQYLASKYEYVLENKE